MDKRPGDTVNNSTRAAGSEPDTAAMLINDFYDVSASQYASTDEDIRPVPRRRVRETERDAANPTDQPADAAAQLMRSTRSGLDELFKNARTLAADRTSEFAAEFTEASTAPGGSDTAAPPHTDADADDAAPDMDMEYVDAMAEADDSHSPDAHAEPERVTKSPKSKRAMFSFGKAGSKSKSKKTGKKTGSKVKHTGEKSNAASGDSGLAAFGYDADMNADDAMEPINDFIASDMMDDADAMSSEPDFTASDMMDDADAMSSEPDFTASDMMDDADAMSSEPDFIASKVVDDADAMSGEPDFIASKVVDDADAMSGEPDFTVPQMADDIDSMTASTDLETVGASADTAGAEAQLASAQTAAKSHGQSRRKVSATAKLNKSANKKFVRRTGSDAHSATATAAAVSSGKHALKSKPTKQGGAKRGAPARLHIQNRRSANGHTPNWTAPVCVVCALLLCGITYIGVSRAVEYANYRGKVDVVSQDTFHEGAKFEGYPLEGLTLDQATTAANELMKTTAENANITVTAGDETFTIGTDDIGLSTNTVNMLSSAYSKYRTGSLDERYQKVQNLMSSGENLVLDRNWDEATLRNRIQQIADDIYVEGKNAGVAEFNVDGGKGSFVFAKEQTGIELDVDDLYQQVTTAVGEGNLNSTIAAKLSIVEPEYDIEYMKDNFGLIATASTDTTSNSNRNKNIKLASSTFNGKVIMPGETFSFNDTTGQRTSSKGYRKAGAYSGGVTVQELGGGVCQVSTTLYQAVCKADLEIVDRSPHSRPSSYTGIGLDAAVSWPGQDFQFRNNTDFPIYLASNYYDRTLTVRVYGHKLEDGMYIRLSSEKTDTISAGGRTERRYDSSLASGETKTERARTGYRAVSYKIYYDSDDDRIKSERLDDSYYAPSNEIVRYG